MRRRSGGSATGRSRAPTCAGGPRRRRTERIGRFKQELFALTAIEKVRKAVSGTAEQLAGEALDRHEVAVDHLPEDKRQAYRAIRRQASTDRPERWEPPQEIEGTKDGEPHDKHLFVEDDGTFAAAGLNNLERRVLGEELARDEVIGWLRNEPRKPWAFSLSYQRHGEAQGMYPDFLLFRRDGQHIVCDVLEPHSQSQADSAAKAKGLATFAEHHGSDFGRIELIDEVSEDGQKVLKRLPLKDPKTQKRVKEVSGAEHLRQLFQDA
ncbi:MAG: hypothetical protein H0T96_05710 [Thermoleophilaceae bacterium]|nr:hypothetical protein [Thermoleophilaceae bacterium]